jgi:hypothetical protein
MPDNKPIIKIHLRLMTDKAENIQPLSADSLVTNTTILPDNLQSNNTIMADNSYKNSQIAPDNLGQNYALVTDNSPDNQQIAADSLPDNNQITPDNLPDSMVYNNQIVADSLPDSTVTNSENVDIFSKISISELIKKYGVGRDTLYTRMRYLQITTWKLAGKAYLYADQIEQMDALHEHIRNNGRMEGYPIPEPTGPVDEELKRVTAIQKVEKIEQPIEQAIEQTTVRVSEQQSLNQAPDFSPGQRQHESSETEAIASLVKNAQNKAAGTLIAENLLARQFIENPEQLPEELRVKIQESGQAPELDPFAYANALMKFAKTSVAA